MELINLRDERAQMEGIISKLTCAACVGRINEIDYFERTHMECTHGRNIFNFKAQMCRMWEG